MGKWLQRYDYSPYADHTKQGDFFTGAGAVFVLNIAAIAVMVALALVIIYSHSRLDWVILIVPWAANIGFLLYFGFTRYWIALGGLTAFTIILLCNTALGATCFYPINY